MELREVALGERPAAGVGRSFLTLGGGEVIARLIAFAATVYLARTLGASVYGVVVLGMAVLLYLTCLTDCGIEALGVHEVAADRGALPATLPGILGARLIVGGTLTIITALMGLFVLPQPEGAVLAMYAFTLPVFALGTRWVHLGLEGPGNASLGRIVGEVATVALVLLLVRGPDDLSLVPVAQLAGEGAGALLLLRLLPSGLHRLRIALHPATIRALLQRSWPLVLHALLGLAIFNSDMIFLRAFRDAASVGYYAAAYTLVSFFLNLGASYTMSLLPVFTRQRADGSAVRTLYHDSLAQALAVALPVAAGGCLVAHRLIELVFGQAYLAASLPLQILLWSVPAAVIRNVSQAVLIAHQRQGQLMYTAAWAAGINLMINLALIPKWGLAGAAAATLATEVVRTVLAARYTDRLGVTMPAMRRLVRVLTATMLMTAVTWWLAPASLVLTIGVGAVGYTLALMAVGALRWRGAALPVFTP